MSVRRTLATLTPEDREPDPVGQPILTLTTDDWAGEGRPLLYGYGRNWIARVAGKSTRTVRRAIARGDLDPASPVAVVAWCASARGRSDLADQIRDLLGPESTR